MPPRRLDPRPGKDIQPVLGVVRVVRTGVVLERLDALVASDRPDRAPEEVAEHDDEVGGDALRVAVQLLRLEHGGGDRVAGVVRDLGDTPRQVVPDDSYSSGGMTPLGSRPFTLRKTRA